MTKMDRTLGAISHRHAMHICQNLRLISLITADEEKYLLDGDLYQNHF